MYDHSHDHTPLHTNPLTTHPHHTTQAQTRLLAWCTDGANPTSTTAAQDILECLLQPLALAQATMPTFGSADNTAPKVLADLLESLLGAVFLDSGVWRMWGV